MCRCAKRPRAPPSELQRAPVGMLNGLILMRMLAPGSKFLSDASLAFPAAPAGVVSNNASQRYYTGNSLGESGRYSEWAIR